MTLKAELENSLLAHVFVKDFFEVSSLDFLSKTVIPALSHENDGVIFSKN